MQKMCALLICIVDDDDIDTGGIRLVFSKIPPCNLLASPVAILRQAIVGSRYPARRLVSVCVHSR